MSFFEKLKNGLLKTKNAIFGGFESIFGKRKIDDELLDELEELLITSDIGVGPTEKIIDELRERVRQNRIRDAGEIKDTLREILTEMIGEAEPLALEPSPAVILVIGVNGVGKTTSIAKIANLLKSEGKSVLLAAGDTFRAAAIDQLGIWAERVGVEMISHGENSDPASVVFDAIAAAKKRKTDVLIIDTAGRLHNKKNLMDELAKINRVIDRELPGCPRENLLVLDATTGQNAVRQAAEFKNSARLTGIILTKLDGTAKGGIVFSIREELDIPVKFICVGEQVDDLQYFSPDEFVAALFD